MGELPLPWSVIITVWGLGLSVIATCQGRWPAPVERKQLGLGA